MLVRWGAGSIPASLRISHTVEAAALTPRTSSSPWILRYPHVLFSRARRSTSRRIDRMVGGRPTCLGRDILACRRVIRSRCQRSTVSGRTSSRRLRSTSRGRRCSRAASQARSARVNRTLLPCSCRSRTVIWCRVPGSRRLYPGCTSAAAAATRACWSRRGTPVETAQRVIIAHCST